MLGYFSEDWLPHNWKILSPHAGDNNINPSNLDILVFFGLKQKKFRVHDLFPEFISTNATQIIN